jgi:hypothetical protein
VQDQLQVRHALGDEWPQRGQYAHVRRRKRADRELARTPLGSLLREPPGMLDASENVLRLLQEDAPRVGQRDVLPAAVQQLDSDRFLELTDLLTQRRLGRAQACGRTREAELLGNRNEIA